MDNIVPVNKVKLLDSLLGVYKKEIEVIYAIGAAWGQLKEEAKNKCIQDFDQAIEAREILLEELAELKDTGVKPDDYEYSLVSTDQMLLKQSSLVKSIYGLDVHSFLNVKKPKLLKPKK